MCQVKYGDYNLKCEIRIMIPFSENFSPKSKRLVAYATANKTIKGREEERRKLTKTANGASKLVHVSKRTRQALPRAEEKNA